MLVLACILVLSVAGQALAAPRAVITVGPNPKNASSPQPSPIRTAVTVNGKPIDVIAHSPEDVTDVAKKIKEMCHGSDKHIYPELCGNQSTVPGTKVGESAGVSQKSGKTPSKTTSSKTLPKPKTTKKALGQVPTTAPFPKQVRPTIKKLSSTSTVASWPDSKKLVAASSQSQKPISSFRATLRTPNKKSSSFPTMSRKTSVKGTTATPAKQTSEKKISAKTSAKPSTISNKQAPLASTGGKSTQAKTLKTSALPSRSAPQPLKSSNKGTATTGGQKKTLKPTSKAPLSSSVPRKSAVASPSSGKPAGSQKSSLPPRTSKLATTSSRVVPTAKSSKGSGPTTLRKIATPSTTVTAAHTHLNHAVSSHKPLANGTYVGKTNTTSSFGKAKFWPFWNSTKLSTKPPVPMPLKQTLVTGEVKPATTFQTVTVPTFKVDNETGAEKIIEEYWDEQVVDGKTKGYWATKTVRSYAAPTLTGQTQDDESMIDFQSEDSEALALDEIEFLSENGWGVIKRDTASQADSQAPHWHNATVDQRENEGVGKGGVTETKTEATPFVPQPTGCTVSVPVVGGLLNVGGVLKTFTSTTAVTRTYDCGDCGPTAEIVTFNAAGKGPVVLPATKTVTAKDAFTEVVRVCSTPAATAP